MFVPFRHRLVSEKLSEVTASVEASANSGVNFTTFETVTPNEVVEGEVGDV